MQSKQEVKGKGQGESSDQVSQVGRATRLGARMQERRCFTYRQLAGGSKQRWRSNHQAVDDKSKTQTRRRGSDWQ